MIQWDGFFINMYNSNRPTFWHPKSVKIGLLAILSDVYDTYDTQIDNAKSDITSKIDIYKNVVPNV
jgi:hypothetical protein